MYKVGDTYYDVNTNKSYQCTSVIRISPTLINERELVSGTWSHSVNSGSGEPANTIVLEDADGNRVVAVLVDEEVDFNATANDIRQGKIAVTDDGVTVGEKFIPSYYATSGYKIIMPGKPFSMKLPDYDLYDYTDFQGIVCPYNKEPATSVACEKVVIDSVVYDALSTTGLSNVQLDSENKSIEFGIENSSGSLYLIRYFTYKEVL